MLGERLRDLRQKAGLTQKDLADAVSLSSSTIAMYEAGKRLPDLESLRRLSEYFGVTSDYLVGLSDDPHRRSGKTHAEQGGQAVVVEVMAQDRPTLDLVHFLRGRSLTEEDVEAIKDLLEVRRLRKEREKSQQ